jgi:hypothetical protein
MLFAAGGAAEQTSVNQLLAARIDQLATVGQNPGAGALLAADANAVVGAPVSAGSFPGSVLIPGTATSLKFYGRVSENAVYYLSGGNPNSSPQNNTVGVQGQVQAIPPRNTIASARGNGIFLQTPRSSRFGVETQTPTALGEVRTVMELDWAGSNSFVPGGTSPTGATDDLTPRLRIAYGTLGGLLAGQSSSNFADADSFAEVLEFGGNVGEAGRTRVPQVRYTIPAWWDSSFSVSAEAAATFLATPAGLEASDAGVTPALTTSCPAAASTTTPAVLTCSTTLLVSGSTPLNPAKTTAPDLTAAWYVPQPWGHFQFSAAFRPGLDVTDGNFFAKHYVGYGGHFSTDIKPDWFGWAKDHVVLSFEGGDTIGSFIQSSSNFDLATNYGRASTSSVAGTYGGFGGPTTAAAAAAVIVKPTQELGGEIGYQHWWLDNLRSNLNAGFNTHFGIPISLVGASQANSINKELFTAHANLIWSPVSFVNVGMEYCWGQRTVLNNQTARLNALISNMRVSF